MTCRKTLQATTVSEIVQITSSKYLSSLDSMSAPFRMVIKGEVLADVAVKNGNEMRAGHASCYKTPRKT
jgi:hypothetical protein